MINMQGSSSPCQDSEHVGWSSAGPALSGHAGYGLPEGKDTRTVPQCCLLAGVSALGLCQANGLAPVNSVVSNYFIFPQQQPKPLTNQACIRHLPQTDWWFTRENGQH